MIKKYRNWILLLLIVLPYIALIPAFFWYKKTLDDIKDSSFIIISKQEMMLYHFNFKGELLQQSPVATGKKFGNKTSVGDLKTPEGVFYIGEIRDASTWTHDFKDDSLGEIKGAYGAYFISLNVPNQKGIGIHGTHDPKSIGTRASEGCIRMPNEELGKLVKHLKSATVVVITPAQTDIDSTIAKSKK
jgi:lipoprotein-anchoring transpeptidase ErfK/SrfK